ncbi:hypothetical protein PG993_001063 [Apiospora rasikravindrae]|uniref:Uncharacterized protein n=1 Tax=Apiospora rasikravindrae TaxID=990691 RepID=A0ABR1UCF1_9PEZI
MTALLEVSLSWLLQNFKHRDDKLFIKGPAFADHPAPTIPVTSPDCGETDAQLSVAYTADGIGHHPELSWTAPVDVRDQIREWLLVSEDPDAPLPTPIAHGVFGGIPVAKTSVKAADFDIQDDGQALLKGGFHYGVTRRGVPYIPPKPLLNHGPHRCKSRKTLAPTIIACSSFTPPGRVGLTLYLLKNPDFFFVVALSAPLESGLLKAKATREQIADAIVGRIVGWGQWVGSCERNWT